jgi:hypothetical protein
VVAAVATASNVIDVAAIGTVRIGSDLIVSTIQWLPVAIVDGCKMTMQNSFSPNVGCQ